jgi:hypothetical protein
VANHLNNTTEIHINIRKKKRGKAGRVEGEKYLRERIKKKRSLYVYI